MSSAVSIATPTRPTSARAISLPGVVAELGRQVEGHRQRGLPALEQEVVAGVRLLRRAEAGELTHRPELPPVHRRIRPPRERGLAGPAQALGERSGPPRRRPPCRAASTGMPESVVTGGAARLAHDAPPPSRARESSIAVDHVAARFVPTGNTAATPSAAAARRRRRAGSSRRARPARRRGPRASRSAQQVAQPARRCAPESTEIPITSASSSAAACTISATLRRRPR